MKRTTGIFALVLFGAFWVGGCGEDDKTTQPPAATATTKPTPTATAIPSPPALSVNQIDRMGRAGVNTALTNPFFDPAIAQQKMMHEAAQDEYNGAANPAQWASMFQSEIAKNLAILDGLDRNCGNQLLAGQGAGQPKAGRYDALAGVLADDVLYVNTASGACQQYLAVEANFLGITNNDCGGRTPLEDTIDTTYSLLAAGALSGVTDGIAKDNDGTASLTAFPFLDVPNS
jgi:hypothetical protein